MVNRAQYAAEGILTDPGLTDNLDDHPAQLLIDWSMTVAKRVAQETDAMPDDEALTYIDDQMYGVRKVLRRINKLYGELDDCTEEDISERLAKIYKGAEGVVALRAHPLSNQKLIATTIKGLTPTDGIPQILNQLSVVAEDDTSSSAEEAPATADDTMPTDPLTEDGGLPTPSFVQEKEAEEQPQNPFNKDSAAGEVLNEDGILTSASLPEHAEAALFEDEEDNNQDNSGENQSGVKN